MCSLFIEERDRYGYDFIDGIFLPQGKDEYYIRNRQVNDFFAASCTGNEGGWTAGLRHLTQDEIKNLEKNNNTCKNWHDVFVSTHFDPCLFRNNYFAGLVRIGNIKNGMLKFHDFTLPTGITGSRIIACDIGDNCAIHQCPYITRYIIGNNALLYMSNEIETSKSL